MKALLTILLVLTCCTPAVADVQKPPVDALDQILTNLHQTLKDPFSLKKLEISYGGVAGSDFPFNKGQQFFCAKFYAKNSFGAYDHFLDVYFFDDKRIVDMGSGPISQLSSTDPCYLYQPVAWKP